MRISLCSVPFLLLAYATGLVFLVLGASLTLITGHTFYNYDALHLALWTEKMTS